MTIDRRSFVFGAAASSASLARGATKRPNVILVLTDDQGYGDLSLHGNPYLKTPHMDAIGSEGVQFTQFQVCPVCSPTRSSLLTGRYNYRTGVVDTFLGRSLMYPDEVTIAELMGSAGYRTGIFGKWHLGDNYPMRAGDQGFQESLVLKGGGIGQPSDPPGSGYFDPVLQHNGVQKKFSGYCTDVYFKAANDWIASASKRPFFAYIAPNAPHSPLVVGEEWTAPFRKQGLPEDVAKVYGMVANIDWNLGGLQENLRARQLERDTLLIFMTDNGPTGPSTRFNAGMRGLKGTVYQGGIRVPCFFRWPGRFAPGKVDRIAAHIDILPTILDVCGIRKPAGLQLDGRSLLGLAERRSVPWPERTLFTQWHRGDVPQAFRSSAVRTQRFKLVDGKELYDLEADPAEKSDVAAAQPETVARLRAEYESWFASVSAVRHYAPPRIYLGTPYENPVTFTRQDWRVAPAERSPVGWWEVDVRRAGRYRVRLTFDPVESAATARIELNGSAKTVNVAKGAQECAFEEIAFAKGPGRLRGSISSGENVKGPQFVEVRAV